MRLKGMSKLLVLLMLALLIPGVIMAATGKVRGIVKNAKTGELLMGANVVIQGTSMGAVADENGEFIILNVPVGKYVLSATYMGYQKVIFENVIVNENLTTFQDFKLPEVVLEGKEVVIVAEKPLVNKSATNDIKILRPENLENLPVRGFANIISAQVGAVQSGADIHVRGGRAEEVGYYIDGVLMNNLYQNQDNPSSTAIMGSVSDNALEEISYQPGGMGAEYGGFNSGVVSTVTKTGGSDYSLSGEVISDQFLSYNKKEFGLGTYSYGYNLYTLSASGPVPMTDSKLRFFANMEYRYRKDRVPSWAPSVATSAFSKDLNELVALDPKPIALYGAKPGSNDIQWNMTGNLYYALKDLKIKAGGLAYTLDYRNYVHAYAPFDAGHMPKGQRQIYTGYLKATYVISPEAFVELNGNYNKSFQEYGDPQIWENFADWTNPSVIPNISQWGTLPASKAQFALFSTYGTPVTWFYRENTDRFTAKGDATWQINKTHELKAGFEAQFHTFRFYDVGSRVSNAVHQKEIELGRALTADELALAYRTGYANNAGYNITGTELVNSGEDAPRKPKIYSVYFQDKMEFRDMVVNLGLRVDHIRYNQSSLQDPYHIVLTDGLVDPSNLGKSPTYTHVNPRLGLAFPVTDQTVFHLEYGKFTQAPPFSNVYLTWYRFAAELSQGNFTTSSNPNLKPKQTTSYEVGLEQQIGGNASLDVTAFYKEIRNEIYLYTFLGATPRPYAAYANGDFGNVKGVSLDFKLRRTNRVMANINYTMQWANGTGSDPNTLFQVVWQNPTERPTYVAPLDYDQRHSATVNVDFRTLPMDGPEILGVHPFGEAGVNFWYTYGSGQPYTPEVAISSVFSDRTHVPTASVNSAYYAPTSSFNFKIDKKINAGSFVLTPYVWVINAFNTENAQTIYAATGLPGEDGYFATQEGKVWAKANPGALEWYKARVANPRNWGEPRQIRLGLRIDYK